MEKKNILFLTKFIPVPAYDGGALRNMAWIKFLSKRYNIILVGFWNKKYGNRFEKSLSKYNIKVFGVFYNNSILYMILTLLRAIILNQAFFIYKYFNRKIKHQINNILDTHKIDFIFCSELSTTQYIDRNILKKFDIYFDEHNVEARLIDRVSRFSGILKNIFLKREYFLLKKFEKKSLDFSKRIFATSNEDKTFFKNCFDLQDEKIIVVPNTFDIQNTLNLNVELSSFPTIIFIGNIGWAPNRHGLLHFLKYIFPEINKNILGLKLNVVGSNIPKKIKKYKDYNINFIENVSEEIKSEIMQESWISVVPLYFASGSRIKILEAWAYKKVVVATDIGIEGLYVPSGTFIAKNDSDFSSIIIRLIKEKNNLKEFGLSNYKMFENQYSFEKVYENFIYNTFTTK
ncbi:MAG: glycosyltransferase family 4 protein [Patescibacteria group bacterium]|nr:glycosyltransferase family 4 protein [Patescibacteria group bacterium]